LFVFDEYSIFSNIWNIDLPKCLCILNIIIIIKSSGLVD
jgi:hypothetical protein